MVPLLFLLAVDLTGTWLSKRQAPTGVTIESTFTFINHDGKFTGTTYGMRGDTPLIDVVSDGQHIQFSVLFKIGGEERRMKYNGAFEGEELILTMERPPGRNMQPMRCKKLTTEEAAARIAARPKPMPLPAVKDLSWNGLAATPPMGWNSFNKFRVDITDKEVREIADAMVASGMKDAGYQYIVIDDGWQGVRDIRGRLQANQKFPDMKALADYVHSKGLKIGLWATPGPIACSQIYPGSFSHEAEDAQQWADWGMDFIKYDWCSAGSIYPMKDQRRVYQHMSELLRATGRPIVLSICQYGDNDVPRWGANTGGNLWRTTFDIRDTWESMSSIGFRQNGLESHAGPGHWNDPDMLEVGNGGMTDIEYRTHFSLWAMLAAPLMAGNDLRNMSAATKEILLNREVIAINQDPLGKQGQAVGFIEGCEIWKKPLENGDIAVGIFNRGDQEFAGQVNWDTLGIYGIKKVRDLWKHSNVDDAEIMYFARIPAHGTVILRLSK